MSWQDKITQPYSITTGDGVEYKPLWDPRKSVVLVQEFNIAEFNFKGLPGSLVDRGEVKGNVYDIEVCFVGDDHLDKAKAFRASAKNKRVWVINHPYYERIIVQPVGLKYDNGDGNMTKITGRVIETIGADKLLAITNSFNAQQNVNISQLKLDTDTTFAAAYVAAVPIPQLPDIKGLSTFAKLMNTLQKAYATVKGDLELAENAYNTANNFVTKIADEAGAVLADVSNAVSYVQYLASLPAVFVNTVLSRVQFLQSQFAALQAQVGNVIPSLKQLYENTAASIISALCLASVTNISPTDYANKPAVLAVIQQLLDTYNQYITNLDTLSTPTGGEPDSYIPDVDSLNMLATLINATVSQLLVIAAQAKQESILVLPEDNNVFPLAYQLYGTTAEDVVDQLISDNNINYKELLIIKKGREIIYYV
jgi:hypothetical protein